MKIARYIGYAHGLFWKLAALLSKFLFLILVVPKLPDTVFAEYIFTMTITLFPGLLLSLGASEHLPIIIRGDREKMENYAPLYSFYLGVCASFMLLYFLTGSMTALLLCVASVHMVYFMLAGLLRSIDPGHYEWLTNQPSILFFLVCLAYNVQSAESLVLLFVITNLMVYIPIARLGKVRLSLVMSDIVKAFTSLFRTSKSGTVKTVSNLLLIADMRALIMAPKLLLKAVPSDKLAMAINIGESVWQLAMVVVNRNYTLYCKGQGSLSSSLKSAVLLMLGMILIGTTLLFVDIPIHINKLDWKIAGWAVLFFAALVTFMELRYFLWARAIGQVWIFIVQTIIIIIQVLIVLFLDSTLWLPVSALAMLCLSVLSLLIVSGLSMRGVFPKL